MAVLKQRLLDYLETLTGERLDLVVKSVSSLPLFLRERYTLVSARLFARNFILALETEGRESGPPGEYGKHAETLRQSIGEPVVFVLPLLPSYARNRMVQMGIPFIVPGSQTFLPNSLIDLRERFAQPPSKPRETLSPAAQCTLLHHLVRGPLDGIPLKLIAEKLNYSPMLITKVKGELETAEICRVVRNSRSMVLEFVATGRALWERILPKLTSPVKKAHWINWPAPAPPALLAGMTALSQRTLIADDRLPTYALTPAAFSDLQELGGVRECPDAATASAKLEIWSYNPHLLAEDHRVDSLSLYLSLRSSGDERVQQQLDRLLEEGKW
jgi:hypothetical protein